MTRGQKMNKPYVEEEILIQFKTATNDKDGKAFFKKHGLDVLNVVARSWFVVKVPVNSEEKWVRKFNQDPHIYIAMLNMKTHSC